jgi:hypothetical protein
MLVIFTLSMAWLVSLGITQVRAIDAARETARAAARSDGSAGAEALGHRVAPPGSSIQVARGPGTIVVTVRSPVGGPAGLFRPLSGFRVTGKAVAAVEPTR